MTRRPRKGDRVVLVDINGVAIIDTHVLDGRKPIVFPTSNLCQTYEITHVRIIGKGVDIFAPLDLEFYLSPGIQATFPAGYISIKESE